MPLVGELLEEWAPVDGFPKYLVSNYGRVMSYNNARCEPKEVVGVLSKDGYRRVYISNGRVSRMAFVHRLVALAFLPNVFGLPVVNHKDENRLNNRVDNLEWCTVKYNTNYNGMPIRRACALRKPILQIDKSGRVVRVWSCRAEVERELGYCGGNITRVCLGQRHTAHGYFWKYANKEEEEAQ